MQSNQFIRQNLQIFYLAVGAATTVFIILHMSLNQEDWAEGISIQYDEGYPIKGSEIDKHDLIPFENESQTIQINTIARYQKILLDIMDTSNDDISPSIYISSKNFKLSDPINDQDSVKEYSSGISDSVYSLFGDSAASGVDPNNFVDRSFNHMLNLFKYTYPDSFKLKNTNKRIPKFYILSRVPTQSPYWRVQLKHLRSNECPLPCEVTEDVNDPELSAIVFHFIDFSILPVHINFKFPKRNLSQPWILLCFEPPTVTDPSKYRQYNGIFNRTMTFRTDSDVVVNEGFVVKKDEIKYLPKSWSSPFPINKKKSTRGSLAMTFISNCKDHSGRLEFIKELKRYAPIHVFGKCGTYKCGSRAYLYHSYSVVNDKCYGMVSRRYLFYLSFENSLCKEYVTEKLYNILYHSMVPVVFGGANYSHILPPGSYINALEYTPKKLANYLIYLQKNPSEYFRYFEWKDHYQVSTFSGSRPLCHLCARLHDPKFYEKSVVKDFRDWYWAKSKCWKWGPMSKNG